MTSASASRPKGGFSGYTFQGPYVEHPEFLDDHAFWIYHLFRNPFLRGHAEEVNEESLLERYDEACMEFHERLLQAAEWIPFTVPLKSGSSLHVVYSPIEEGQVSADYHLSHPGWERTETLAYLYGNYDGYPALSWPELTAAIGSEVPCGCTEDPRKRLLLLWPAMSDDNVPDESAGMLAAALSACTPVADPGRVAQLMAAAHKDARWRFENGIRVTDDRGSFRCPSSTYWPMSRDSLARVSAALEP